MAGAKPKTIRATDETMEKLKKISEEMGASNQGAALDSLIDLYERDQARTVLPERQTEIDDFNLLLRKLGTAYTASLQLNADAEDRARAAYANQLTIYEETIKQQKEQIADLKEQASHANEYLGTIIKLREDIEGKDKLLDVIKQGTDASKEQIADLQKQVDESAELQDKIHELNAQVAELQRQLADEKVAAQKAQVEAQAKANEQIAATIERFSKLLGKENADGLA